MKSLPLRTVLAGLFVLTLTLSPLHAQLPSMSDVDRGNQPASSGPLPDWDVALIKPHPAEDHNMRWQITPDGESLVNLTLEQMICSAWNLKPYQVSGLSGWMTGTTFDLTAKVSAEDGAAFSKLSTTQRRAMLQKLLIDRFKLQTRSETRILPLYDLVVDKSGSKLKPTTAIDAPSEEERRLSPEKYRKGFAAWGPGTYDGTGVALHSMASQLANALGKPVRDATGLTGSYDIALHYRPEETAANNEHSDAPSIFSAVQEQLGLKLVPGKGPVETLSVLAAQKPDAN